MSPSGALRRIDPWRRLIRGPAVLLLAVVMLAGCAGNTLRPGDAPKAAPLPAGMDRDELLSTIAACHLRRVAQNEDRGATDAVVITAVEAYGFSVQKMVERANQLTVAATNPANHQSMRRLARDACELLAELTQTSPSLVRFDESGQLDSTWLVVKGEIDDGFADEVIGKLRAEKAVGLLITSPGGSLFEARRLGRYLRQNGLRVGVSGICTSACIDVLAGGIERYVTPRAKLGIHQSKVPAHLSSHEGGQLSVAAAALYLREMGIDEVVALAAASVPNESMYWISVAEALKTGLATELVDTL
jgi:ATP-dependent protease ClpP protease subunit